MPPPRKPKNPKQLPALSWKKCPAKTCEDGTPGTSTLVHCDQAAEVMRALIRRLPPFVISLLGSNPTLASALHDNGKISPGYQLKYFSSFLLRAVSALTGWSLDTWRYDKVARRHATVGGAAVKEYLERLGQEAPLFVALIDIHHGVWDGGRISPDSPLFGGDLWLEERVGFIEHQIARYGDIPKDDFVFSVLAGLLVVSDWISSDTENFPPEGLPPGVTIEEQAEKAVSSCWGDKVSIKKGLSFEEVFGFPPRPFQGEFTDTIDGPGIYILEAPPGLGKTEAVLYSAYKLLEQGHNYGIYFALHTRLASSKIFDRFRPFIDAITEQDTSSILTHGTAWLERFGSGGGFRPGGRWFEASKRAILAPFAVGTIDQALLSVLGVRHYFLRSFGLAGKVVILDEVDSYDLYTSTHIQELVRQLRQIGCTVIILSATLTQRLRNSFFKMPETFEHTDTYPVVCKETPTSSGATPLTGGPSKRVKVSVEDLDGLQVAEEALRRAQHGECIMCITNTVDKAQEWYQCITEDPRSQGIEVGLLHSRFPQWRRDEIEDKWTTAYGKDGPRPNGAILVSTQIAEQSLDLDSDFEITELAPTDRMFQRIGRMFRHEDRIRPCSQAEVLIVSPDVNLHTSMSDDNLDMGALEEILGESNCRVYDPYWLWKTYQVWYRLSEINLPEDYRKINEATYEGGSKARMGLPEYAEYALEKKEAKDEGKKDLALSVQSSIWEPTLNGDVPDKEDSGWTRYSEYDTVDVLLFKDIRQPHLSDQYVSLELSNGEWVDLHEDNRDVAASIKLHKNVVPIPEYLLEKVSTGYPAFLKKHFHEKSGLVLLCILPDGGLTPHSSAVPLRKIRYSDDLGVFREILLTP